MKTLLAACLAGLLALSATAAVAADDKKPAAAKADAKLVKPASVKQDAWDKMTDAEKKKAVADAKASKTAAAPKKEKKGGC